MTIDQLRQAAELQKQMQHRTENAVENVNNKRAYHAACDAIDFPSLLAEMEQMRETLENFTNELHAASIAGGRAWDEVKLYALLNKCIDYRRGHQYGVHHKEV